MNIIEWLKGKKSYVIAIGAVAYGLYMGFSGAMEWKEVLPYILGGGGLAAIRAALAKIGIVI